MAKSVLELAVETGKWDAGLKKAKSALDNFTQSQGGLQQALSQDSEKMQAFVRMIGETESTAKTAKGQMNDYKSTIEQLTMQYNRMTDAQKKTIGQDYLHSIDLLKQKYQSVNDEIQEMNRSLSQTKLPDISSVGGGFLSGEKIDGMLQVFGGNLMTKGFDLAANAVTSMANEIGDCIKQGIQLAKSGEGIRIAFERLGRGDILNGLREATHGTVTDIELMKAAVKFNDFRLPIEELGTMLAFAQQKAKDTGQSVDYMVDSIVTGLGRKSLMILDNLGLSASEIKEKMAETGDMTKAVGEIIREQMSKAGDYVETAADRANQANVSLQNKMEELGRKFAPLEQASTSFWTSVKISILDVVGGPLAEFLNGLTEAGRQMQMLNNVRGGGNGNPTVVDNQLNALRGSNYKDAKYYSQLHQYNQDIKAAEEYKKAYQEAGLSGGSVLNDVSRRFNVKVRGGEDIDNLIVSLRTMREEYMKGAKAIMHPVTVDINTEKAEQNLDALKIKLIELEAQRKKAITAGDSDKVKNLTQQINSTKRDIKALDPNAATTTRTKQEQAEELVKSALLSYNQTIEKANIELQSGRADEEKVKKQNLSALEQLWTAYGKAYDTYADPKYKDAQDKTVNDIIGLGGEIKLLEEAQKKAKEAAQLQERAQRKLAEALTELYNAIEKGDVQSIVTAQKKVTTSREEYDRSVSINSNAVSTTQTVDVLTGSVELPDIPKEVTQTVDVVPGSIDLPQIPETVDIYANVVASEASVASAMKEIQRAVSQAAVGSTEYDTEQKRLADITSLNSIISVEKKYNLKADAGKQSDILRQILGRTDIDDSVWQELETSINEQLSKLNIKPIKIDLKTGKLTEDANKATEAWKEAASAISTVGQSLQSIEDPAAKVIGLVAQAVASVAASAGSIMAQNASERQMTWYEYLAMGASVTAQMIATISAIHSATGYAEGGIVKGNTYSGDMIPANGGAITLNAGELILNRSQQATLAADIGRSSVVGGGGSSQPYVTADKIVLGINNWGKKTGRGELIFSR